MLLLLLMAILYNTMEIVKVTLELESNILHCGFSTDTVVKQTRSLAIVATAGDEAKIGARIGCSDSRSRQIWIERQIEPRRPVLQSGEQQHLHCIKADGAKPQRFAHGPFHLVLMEILHQPQYLDELAPSHGPHPSFHEPPQPMNAVRKPPIVQRRRLIERLGLLFEQRQIMQRIV